MIKHIEVDAFVKVLGDDTPGMSKPIQVIGDDGKSYILKNQNVFDHREQSWVNWDSMFLQEVLVHRIANYLSIKTPDCAIANVDPLFLEMAPSLRFNHRYVPGFHFASGLVDNVDSNLKEGYLRLMELGKPYIKRSWNKFIKDITNKEDIPKIIVLDLLTANFDRFGNTGNLLIASENGRRYVYAIDHGHCFWGPSWNSLIKKQRLMKIHSRQEYYQQWLTTLIQSSDAPMSGLGKLFKSMEQFIDVSDPKDHCFIDVVHITNQITPNTIDKWFEDIPDEWFVDKPNQISIFKSFIMENVRNLPYYINQMAKYGAFDSTYLGGDLEWPVKHTGTL